MSKRDPILDALRAELDKHRDPAFMARIRERIRRDKAILDRLAESERDDLRATLGGDGVSDA